MPLLSQEIRNLESNEGKHYQNAQGIRTTTTKDIKKESSEAESTEFKPERAVFKCDKCEFSTICVI